MHNGKITESTVVIAADGLSVAELDGEAVILSAQKGTYFGLNEAGARAFELARQPRPIREIVETMSQEYDVSRDRLAEDLLRFFEEMRAAELIKTGGSGTSA